METPVEQKARLRKRYLTARRAMTPEAWTRASEAICRHLLESSCYEATETLLTYVSARDNEVDTWALIDAALASERAVLTPIVIQGDKMLRWARIVSREQLVRGRFGLLEPDLTRTSCMEPPSDALCLTPGVAFTRTGERIGYGGGYYDRFLSDFKGVSVGLAFDLQLTNSLPTMPHDQPVDYVLTESGWHPDTPANEPR